VHASLPCLVELRQGAAFGVSFTADDNVVDHLRAVKEGEALKLELEHGSYHLRTPLVARITMPSIAGLRLDGAAHSKIEGFDSRQPFRADLDGASKLEGSLNAGEVTLECDGAGRATLRGAADVLKIKANGASHLDLGEMSAGTIDVTLDGASKATVNAREQLSYSAHGVSHLEYAGEPRIASAKKDQLSSVSRTH
jgi:hypothetical protein